MAWDCEIYICVMYRMEDFLNSDLFLACLLEQDIEKQAGWIYSCLWLLACFIILVKSLICLVSKFIHV